MVFSIAWLPNLSLISWPIFGCRLHEPPAKGSFQSLPNELILHVFSFLELKPYIISHGVCKKWRRLLPLTDIHPIRKRLFNLFHSMINAPEFRLMQPWTIANLQPFDRQAYINSLLSQYPAVPEEFRFWILEWPARMAIKSMWPALPFTECWCHTPVRKFGVSWISYRPSSPLLSALIYKANTTHAKFVPALLVWRSANESVWLIFDQDEPQLLGRVYRLDGTAYAVSEIPYVRPIDHEEASTEGNDIDSEETEDEGEGEGMLTYADWISYQEYLLGHTILRLQLGTAQYFDPDEPIPQPVEFSFEDMPPTKLPAPTWDSRHLYMDYLQY